MQDTKPKNKGFTLVELMVTITIFSIIIEIILGIFILGIRQQRISLNTQLTLDQLSYALEFMSRSLRMAKKELGENCLTVIGYNYENPSNNSFSIRFINTLDGNDCQEFFLEDGQLKYRKDINNSSETFPLTSTSTLEITALTFTLEGASQEDKLQPKVSIYLEATSKIDPARKIKIQTTISQRVLDVKY